MLMMSEWEGTAWAGESVPMTLSLPDETLSQMVGRMTRTTQTYRPWRVPTIADALGVPGLQRAVTLISNTTGALTMQAFRNRTLVETPRVIARPDPYRTARDFYRDSAYNMATRGEVVWLIASRDSENWPTALVVVPLPELQIEDNPRNRLLPTYRWGDRVGTRYSPANRTGDFVHVTYLQEPGELRGMGPLQMGRAAVSVAVEAQEWAANFYADGGNPSVLIKVRGQLGGKLDEGTDYEPIEEEDAESEADRLRSQWVGRPHNLPRVIDENIDSVEYHEPNESGAQMLASRNHGNGDAARMFGMPGALLEFGVDGASLTYQSLADVWVNFVRGCLAPNYLEPIEQALGDCVPRAMSTRFLTSGLQRGNDKARWEMYNLMVAVLGQARAAEVAAIGEDLDPGNPEVAAVPFAAPAAIPSSLPRVMSTAGPSEVRCKGTVQVRGQSQRCGRLLGRFRAPYEVGCPRCKAVAAAA